MKACPEDEGFCMTDFTKFAALHSTSHQLCKPAWVDPDEEWPTLSSSDSEPVSGSGATAPTDSHAETYDTVSENAEFDTE